MRCAEGAGKSQVSSQRGAAHIGQTRKSTHASPTEEASGVCGGRVGAAGWQVGRQVGRGCKCVTRPVSVVACLCRRCLSLSLPVSVVVCLCRRLSLSSSVSVVWGCNCVKKQGKGSRNDNTHQLCFDGALYVGCWREVERERERERGAHETGAHAHAAQRNYARGAVGQEGRWKQARRRSGGGTPHAAANAGTCLVGGGLVGELPSGASLEDLCVARGPVRYAGCELEGGAKELVHGKVLQLHRCAAASLPQWQDVTRRTCRRTGTSTSTSTDAPPQHQQSTNQSINHEHKARRARVGGHWLWRCGIACERAMARWLAGRVGLSSYGALAVAGRAGRRCFVRVRMRQALPCLLVIYAAALMHD